ncbi:MAG: phosphate acyltransferase PlsX [Parachlamydiales bacterium]|jgi:glycerol-3-phosphate acyltransferase PlsX
MIKLGIDLLGGDSPPELLLEAMVQFAKTLPKPVRFICIATFAFKKAVFAAAKKAPRGCFSFCEAENAITMEENPLFAVRRKKKSSMALGMRLLKEGSVDALVSAGNTGALVSLSKIYLPMLPGIARPALLALMPTQKKRIAVLDVGANIVCKAKHLVQFAKLGAAYQRASLITNPAVGLLNIGSEAKKGTLEVKKAYLELTKIADLCGFEFLGNIEGKEVFQSPVDVLVTEGFTGNIFLKTAEGITNFILDRLQNLDDELLFDLKKSLHYAEYPGALLCGLSKVIIKCHGYSTPAAFLSGIKEAVHLVSTNKIAKIKTFFTQD